MTNPTTPAPPPPPTWSDAMVYPIATVGAILGAGFGGFVTKLAAQSGFYAIIAVGFCAGFTAAFFARRRNLVIGIIAALVTLAVSIYTEWWVFPFSLDTSLTYFLGHLQDLPGFRMLAHVAGVAIAFYLGWRK